MNSFNFPSSTDFLSHLHRISGPTVKIKIGSSPQVHEVSEEMLCEKSPYFAAMFKGKFKETTKNAVTIQEIEGVVSVHSFSMLIEWIYLGRIDYNTAKTEEQISALIEFARFADMCMVSEGLFDLIRHSLSHVIRCSRCDAVQNISYSQLRYVTKEHIGSAMRLPLGNPVRNLMVKACVRDFLGPTNFKFENEIREVDNFAADLLCTVQNTLKDATYGKGAINFEDPFDSTRGVLFAKDGSRYHR
ncbi:uncharacterized protein N7503_005795 [Penicillium pulvis]|uniref:uncharacterized protein n=1 Tax=Penicillium pulvis TaxID=1562058 RepID=UPI002546EBDB|nr:uncharacterized protein N7503_005795 [Penicillium pulvis]KAJ5803345.1 hypothetical protein N7503_005795 [Penicillium pulvis]